MSTCRYLGDTINLDLTEISPFAVGRLTYGEAVWGAEAMYYGRVLMADTWQTCCLPTDHLIAGGRTFVVVSQQNYVKPKSSGAAQQQVWAMD